MTRVEAGLIFSFMLKRLLPVTGINEFLLFQKIQRSLAVLTFIASRAQPLFILLTSTEVVKRLMARLNAVLPVAMRLVTMRW